MRTLLIVAMLAISAFGTLNEMESQELLGLSPDGVRFAILHKTWDDGPKSNCSCSILVYQTDSMQIEKEFPLGALSPGMDEKNSSDNAFTQNMTDAKQVLVELQIAEGIKPKPRLENGVEHYIVNSTLQLDFTADYPRQTYSLQFHNGSMSVRGKGQVERNDVDESQWNKYSVRAVQFSPDLTYCVAVVRHYNGQGGSYQKDVLYSFRAETPQKGN